ncbi:hypothetical protein PIROE2DRAFT_43180, partial [Piromyces sp. E2]
YQSPIPMENDESDFEEEKEHDENDFEEEKEHDETDDYTSAISNYELERQRRIQKNNECLVNLGLLMELNKNNSSSNNYIYFQKIFNTPPEKDFNFEERKLFIIFIPHLDIPSTYIFRRSQMEWITEYRHFIIEQAKAAVNKLKNGGLFIVGGKDIKKYLRSEYIPLSILLYEDIVRSVSVDELKLREFFIVTPEGYECDNKNVDVTKMKEKLKQTYAEYEQEKIIENKYFDGQFTNHANIRRIAPIVNVSLIYFYYLNIQFFF